MVTLHREIDMNKTHLRIIRNIKGWALIDPHAGGNGIIATRDIKEEIIKTAKRIFEEYQNHYDSEITINTYSSNFKVQSEIINLKEEK